jgi:hypothetical protein
MKGDGEMFENFRMVPKEWCRLCHEVCMPEFPAIREMVP